MLRPALLSSALLLACTAATAQTPAACSSIAMARGAIVAHDGKWTDLTPAQWQFLRGVYVINPDMPLPGLPYGDRGAIARVPGNDGALVFFVDGDKACTPMPIPKLMVEMLDDIEAQRLNHDGTPD